MTDTNTEVLNPRGDPRAGTGQIYVFQFPVSYFENPNPNVLQVIPIGTERGYQAKTAPVLASNGQAMYVQRACAVNDFQDFFEIITDTFAF